VRFLISVRVDEATAWLTVTGELDLGSTSSMRDAIRSALSDDSIRLVVIDLGEVTFLDCSGLAALIEGRRLADERDVGYRVRNATGLPRTVLRLTGTEDYLDSAPPARTSTG
jgi:anti-sigma B factor antagonist